MLHTLDGKIEDTKPTIIDVSASREYIHKFIKMNEISIVIFSICKVFLKLALVTSNKSGFNVPCHFKWDLRQILPF